MEGYKLVQMNMREPTLKKVEALKGLLQTGNRTDAVKTAIDIAELVTQTIQNRGRVVIEAADGTRTSLTIPGLDIKP